MNSIKLNSMKAEGERWGGSSCVQSDSSSGSL